MRAPLLPFLLLLLLAGGCAAPQNRAPGGRLRITATTGMVQDAVRHITGDRADVQGLMRPGVDPHLYKAGRSDLDLLTDADLIVHNGLHLEGKMASLFHKIARYKPVWAMSDGLPPERIHHHGGAPDPHIWFDVSLWARAVAGLSERLQALDSANAGYYRENTQRYLVRLDSLHRAVQAAVAGIPPQRRVLITAHDAFGYFGEAYGMEVKGLQGISTLSDYGLRDITDLTAFIAARGIRAVFVEASVPERSIRAVVEGCRERGHEVIIGGSLFTDALDEPGRPAGTYIGMVHHNVRAIAENLK
jgi:manganese/zinc/iron transport system substrate-binding protein